MAHFVVQVVFAHPDSLVGVGAVIGEFETEAEAAYFLSVAARLRPFQRCTLGVRKELGLPRPGWMATAA